MKTPCTNCERSGCGSYHDECEKFKEYKLQREEIRKERINSYDNYTYKKRFEHPTNSPLKTHRK